MPWPKGRKHTKKEKEKIKKSALKYYSNPVVIKKFSNRWKKYWQKHPESIQKIDRAMTAWWKEHPHVRKEKSIEMKNFFMKNPEKFKKFMKYGNNPAYPRFKTKSGFLVKSRGEQRIANFLFENKIKALYEEKTLFFPKEGQICIPDFWLPKFKVYIEFYGGFPQAWKKKVMKNKLYRKHKIKCVFITPRELRNLEYYLGREVGRN
jgi:hypothetical protein